MSGISRKQRLAVLFVRQQGRCYLCGRRMNTKRRGTHPRGRNATLEHVVPRSKGGRGTWENLRAACFECNQRKADRLLETECE